MSRPLSLSQVMSIPDILDQTRYLMSFGSIPGGGESRSLSIKCFNCTIPGMSNEAFEAMMGGVPSVNFRGRPIMNSPISLSFYEDSRMLTLSRLRTWSQMCAGSESGNSQGYIDEYSVTAKLFVFDTTGEIAAEHKIYRMYPVEIPEITLSSESSAPVQVQTSFRFTTFESSTHVTR